MKKYTLKTFLVILLLLLTVVSCPPPTTPSSTKAITAFYFTSPAATGIINESAKTMGTKSYR